MMSVKKYLFSTILIANAGSAFAEFHPVIVTYQQGTANDAVKAGIIEVLSEAIQKGALKSLVSNISGKGEIFKNKAPTGALAGLTKAFLEIDGNVNKGFQALKATKGQSLAGSNWSFEIHMTWTDRRNFPPLTEQLGGRMFAMLWTLGETQMRDALQKGNLDALGKAISYANTIPLVNGNAVPGGIQGFFEDGVRAYVDLASTPGNEWMPLYMRLKVTLVENQLTIETSALVRPATIKLKLDDVNLVSARALTYEPALGMRPATQIGFTKTYGSTRSESRPLMQVTFGNILQNDIRGISFCKMNCEKILYHVPTLALKLTPSFAVPAGAKQAASLVGAVLSPFLDFFILIKQIVIDFSDPEGPRILPERSQMLFVSRQQSPAGELLQVINSTDEITTIDTTKIAVEAGKSILTGTIPDMSNGIPTKSLNIYDKLIGHALEDKMTNQVRSGLDTLNTTADQKLNSSLASISALFK